jgi:hypothetical protein
MASCPEIGRVLPLGTLPRRYSRSGRARWRKLTKRRGEFSGISQDMSGGYVLAGVTYPKTQCAAQGAVHLGSENEVLTSESAVRSRRRGRQRAGEAKGIAKSDPFGLPKFMAAMKFSDSSGHGSRSREAAGLQAHGRARGPVASSAKLSPVPPPSTSF